jgi:hypothetical protein
VAGKQAWTDVARFAEVGVPALNYGPGLTAQAHQRGEYVPVDALVDAMRGCVASSTLIRPGRCSMIECRFVPLADAVPDGAVVVIDVLRAFTVQPWLFHRGAARILTVTEEEQAIALRDTSTSPTRCSPARTAGVQIEGFDLGNSPTQVAASDVTGRTIIHRTSAGTQGLARTAGSDLVLAAAFVTAGATVEGCWRRRRSA